jgi:outer membrane protein TolC
MSMERGKAVVAVLAALQTLAISEAALAQPTSAPPSQTGGGPYPPTSTTQSEVPNELLRVNPGGYTADRVGQRAMATSFAAKAQEGTLRSAAARLDVAWAAFLPRLTGTARYTRLSDFSPPSFGAPPGVSAVYTLAPPGTINPTPTESQSASISLPLVLDNYLLQGTITVPISDYFLRINQNYSAATHSQEAARFDLASARVTSAANGKIAFYTWLRSRGAVIVAVQALNDQKIHLELARNQFAVGQASRADVLRAETNVASAELALERAKNLADLSEKQVRVAVHAKDDEPLLPGESLESVLPPVQGNIRELENEALATRLEIKSIDANAASARETAKAMRGAGYPALSAFADGIYANPNPRRFPQTNEWFPTWDLGAQVVWSPNDTIAARGNASDYEARAGALEAQKGTTRDNIEVEVVQSYQAVREADFSIDSAQRELASAEEAYRVARELFNNGRATSTTLTDAETELTRSRLDLLNARADARTARVRLEHALGRDVRMASGTP